MTNDLLRPGERLDDLLIGNLKIIQHAREFCFSLDAVLLAHFAYVRPGAQVVDLGTGTGVLGLLLTTRGAGQVSGIEINPTMADMARRSVEYNGLTEKVRIVAGDVRQIADLPLPAGACDLVVANPPYRPLGGGYISPNDKVAMAKHEVTGSLADFVAAARHLVKFRGRFAMVHLPERMAEILKAMSDAGIEPKRLQLVYPSPVKKPKFLLVEGVRGANPGLDVLPPLFVYNTDGGYSEEILAYYSEPGIRTGEYGDD